MIKSRGSARRGRLIVVAALAIACGTVFFSSVGTASAGNLIVCGGKIKPLNKKKPDVEAKYTIQCSEDIRGYSITTSQQLDFFGTEVEVAPNLEQSAVIQCEGSVPGFGIGCGVPDALISTAPSCTSTSSSGSSGCATAPPCGTQINTTGVARPKCAQRVDAGNLISGEIHFAKSPCEAKNKLSATVSAASTPITPSFNPAGDRYSTGVYASQPFKLKTKGWSAKKCPKVKKGKEKKS